MIDYHLDINIKIIPTHPWHIGSGLGRADLNRLTIKDGLNRPYIPGSHLKGILRQSCENLATTIGLDVVSPHQRDHLASFTGSRDTIFIIDRLFGSRFEGGKLFCRSAYWSEDAEKAFYERAHITSQTRTAIDRALQTSKEKHLFQTEYVHGGFFSTTISGRHNFLTSEQKGDWPVEYALLLGGLCLLDRMGGDKTHGKGQISIVIDEIRFNGEIVSLEAALEPLVEEEMSLWIIMQREELYGV